MTTSAWDLPRILIIDDQLGTGSAQRKQVLERLAILDSSRAGGDDAFNYLAKADICTAISDGKFSASALHEELIKVQRPMRWDLVLVDYHFYSEREERDEIGAQRIVKFLTTNHCADKDAFILFTRSEVDEQTVKSALCKGYLRKPTRNLSEEEVAERRRQFGRVLFENGCFTDGPVRYVDPAGRIVHKGDHASYFGNTISTRRLLRSSRRALIQWSKTHSPFLIVGRSGDGRTELARYIHRWSEAALSYTGELGDHSRVPQEGEFRVISSGELGAAFLSALLLQGDFTTLNDLWDRMWRDTIVVREVECFDPETLKGLARCAIEDPRSRLRLLVFTTSRSTSDLVDSGRISAEFMSKISSVLHVPRMGRRMDPEAIFLSELMKAGPTLQPFKPAELSQEAQQYLKNMAQDDEVTFGHLKAMARLESEWQAAHQGTKNSRMIGLDRLRVWYSQTKTLVLPEVGLRLMLERLERYQLTPADKVKDGLTHLRNAVKPIFMQMVAAAYSACSEDRNATARHLGGEIPLGNAGYAGVDYLKRWFKFLEVDDDPLYKRIAADSSRARSSKAKK